MLGRPFAMGARCKNTRCFPFCSSLLIYYTSPALLNGRKPAPWPFFDVAGAQPVRVHLPPAVLVELAWSGGMLAGRTLLLLHSLYCTTTWLFRPRELAYASAFLNGRKMAPWPFWTLPVPNQCPHPCHATRRLNEVGRVCRLSLGGRE